MPLNKVALYRYRLIDQRLQNTMLAPPSVDELIDYVADKLGKSISRRTILSDIKSMREDADLDYFAPIAYDKVQKGYYYTEEGYSISKFPISAYELQGLEIAIGMLRRFNKLPVMQQFEDALLKIADTVSLNRKKMEAEGVLHLEVPTRFKGLEWLPDIAEAIKKREILRLRYQSFKRDEPKEYRIEPYHLREFNQRFYVLAKSLGGERPGLRTFGLDRILEIWPTFDYFDEKHFDDAAYFKNAIGITVPDKEAQKILLSFTPHMGRYIKAQPLHQSQKITQENQQELRISLFLVINPELIRLILGYGTGVRVLQPQSLAKEIEKEAEKVSNLYK